MKAAVYRAPGDIALEDRDMPVCGDDELLLRVRAASVCGTDMRIFKSGHFKIPASTHRVLGHEVAGVIAKVGRFVSGFAEGMRVTVTPNIGCGRCKLCRRGYNNMCPNYEAFGISLDGGFEDYMRVPNIAVRGGNVFAIPDGVSSKKPPWSSRCLRVQRLPGIEGHAQGSRAISARGRSAPFSPNSRSSTG